ncbi:MAG TPA: response regulator [Patescibacteria group bacterium]|nr:response regulator [Gammaproteobacteria bacterium]HWA52483.1 response regulator [Patescibacteria group bacterium]
MLRTHLLTKFNEKQIAEEAKELLFNFGCVTQDVPGKNITLVKFKKIVNGFSSAEASNSLASEIEPIKHNQTSKPTFSKTDKLQVLVVEDDRIAQHFHKKILLDMDCIVHTVENAEEATAILLHNSYDLILLDILLPDKTGYELAAEIGRKQKIKQPIVAVTINVNEHTIAQCRAAGIDEVFCKPLSAEKIKGIISNISSEGKDKPQNLYTEQELINHYAVALKNAPKPDNMSKTQYFNYLAIQLLEEMGNDSPAQLAIDYVESFLQRYSRRKHVVSVQANIA